MIQPNPQADVEEKIGTSYCHMFFLLTEKFPKHLQGSHHLNCYMDRVSEDRCQYQPLNLQLFYKMQALKMHNPVIGFPL